MIRLSFAYLVALFAAFAVVAGVSSLLYALDIGEYRYLSFMIGGWAEAGFGEFHGRLIGLLGALFIALSVIVGLPGACLLDRHDHETTEGFFVTLGVIFGPVTGLLGGLIEGKLSWFLFGSLLGAVWALVFLCITDRLPISRGGEDPIVVQKTAIFQREKESSTSGVSSENKS